MNIFGILQKEGNSIEKVDESIEAIDEDEYNIASKFLLENINDKCLCSSYDAGYFSPVSIRSRILTNSEYYYCKKKDGRYELIISVVPNLKNTNVVVVTNVIYNALLDYEYLVDSVKKMYEYITSSMVKKVTKIRVSFLSKNDSEEYVKFLKLFKDVGFKLEATLENETENRNLYMYSLE